MDKWYLVAAIIIAAIALWAFGVRYEAMPAEVATTTVATTSADAAPATAPGKPAATTPKQTGPTPLQSLQALVRNMGNTKCTYEQVSGAGSTVRSTNDLYISGGKIRGEFRSRDGQGLSTNTIMLFNGTTLYTWTEGKSTGTKTSVRSADDVAVLLPKSLLGDKVLGTSLESVGWDCHPWIPDTSILAVPTYVAF